MINLFQLMGSISVDNKKANSEIDQTVDKAEGAHSKMGAAFSKIGSAAIGVGKVVGAGMLAAGAAFGGLAIKALNLGGELEQNLGGSEAVFKDYAGRMQEIGKSAFKDMGLSQSDFLATANKMGALFQGAGFSIAESSDISSKAMQRAADVASIMGIDTASAMEAVAGAAKGNFTMMDNLGVAMNDTQIQAYAMSKGINKSTQAMTQQEKIGLAMEMFLEKTAYAAGNYAKENETLAGSLTTSKAALTNFLDGSGTTEDLVTSLVGTANVITDRIGELLPRLVTGLSDLITQLIPKIPPILQAVLPGIITGAVGLMNGLLAAIPSLMTILLDSLPLLIDGFVTLIVTLVQYLPEIILPIIQRLPEIVMAIVRALMDNLPILITGLVDLVVGIVAALPQIMMELIKALPGLLTSIFNGLWEARSILIDGFGQIIKQLGENVWILMKSIFAPVANFFSGIWDGIKGAFGAVGTWFKDTFSGAWNAVKDVFSTGGKIFDGIKDGISSVFKTVVNGLIGGINKVISVPFNAINTMLGKIRDISILGVSPFNWIKTFTVPQIPTLATGGVLKKGQTGYLEGEGDEAVVPLEKNDGWIDRLAEKLLVSQTKVDVRFPVQTQTQTQMESRPIIINIDKFINNRKQDVEQLADELLYIMEEKRVSREAVFS